LIHADTYCWISKEAQSLCTILLIKNRFVSIRRNRFVRCMRSRDRLMWVPTVTTPHVQSKSGQTGLTTVLPVNGRRPGIANEFVCDRMVMLLRAVLMLTIEWIREREREREGCKGDTGEEGRNSERAKAEERRGRRKKLRGLLRVVSWTRACVVRVTHAYDASYVRYHSIRQFAIYCLDFNLPSEWPWALPPLPTDIRRRKLPIVSMELDSYCAPTFTPRSNNARTCTHECIVTTRVRFFGKPTMPRTPLDFRRNVNQWEFLR